MSARDGGPAFPATGTNPGSAPGTRIDWCQPGMSKREWFAGQALSGYAANEGCYLSDDKKVARWAVELADALLAELARRDEEPTP